MSDYERYLNTLRRVPDDVILATAAADLELGDPNACLCGWFVREQVGRMLNLDPETIGAQGQEVVSVSEGGVVTDSCANLFGGTENEWRAIFSGVIERGPTVAAHIEEAFVERVLECVP